MSYRIFAVVALFLSGLLPGSTWPVVSPRAALSGSGTIAQDNLAPYVPTPQDVVDRMLELAQVGKADVIYDLGSGDGRVVVTAAKKYGAKSVGFEIDPVLVSWSRRNIKEAGVAHLAEIREQDLMTVDLSPATVVTLYLYPAANLRLRPQLRRQLKPGSRVVSHDFGMGDWKPDHVEQMTDSSGLLRTIYLWRIR